MTAFSQTFTLTASTAQPTTKRNWFDNPGQNGSMWVQPFYNTVTWDTSSANRTQLFSQGGSVNLWPNFAAPFYIGRATDPTVTVTDGNHTITVHLPAGSMVEQPTSSVDQSIGGVDVTQPYLYWNISGATIDGNPQGTVKQDSIIRGTYGFMVGDGSGLIMEDVVTGTFSQNAMGNIQEFDLLNAVASSTFVIQHMLNYQIPPSFFNNNHVWPLAANDVNGTGASPEGTVIGIPQTVTRPTGKSRGFYLLFDNLQQYGWLCYNVSGAPGINIMVISQSSQTASLASDIVNSINSVLAYGAIMTNVQSATAVKGFQSGATPLYTPPLPLDLSPTGGVAVLPSSFGAWYPGGYNTPSSNSTGTGAFQMVNGQIIDPNGAVFVARGINVYDGDIGTVSTSSACTPLLTAFPKCNFVRVPCYSYNSASFYQTFVTQATAKGIVVELEHHIAAGGGVPPLTGSDLTAENNWFSALATAFKTNPYVWFGTMNEPSGPGSTLTAQQVSNYNAIRGQGNNNPIMMEILGDYDTGVLVIGAGHGLTASSYTSMTNIIWDLHFYNGLPDFNPNNNTNSYSTNQTIENNLVTSYIQQAQTITSADGTVPVIIGEYGVSTDGSNLDPGGTQACIASQTCPSGCAAFVWRSPGTPYNILTNNDNSLTSYGQQIAGWMAAQAGP